jgi:hypothetical protein
VALGSAVGGTTLGVVLTVCLSAVLGGWCGWRLECQREARQSHEEDHPPSGG